MSTVIDRRITSCIQDRICSQSPGWFRFCRIQDKGIPNHRNTWILPRQTQGTAVIILNYSNHEERTIQKGIEAGVNFALKLPALSLAMQSPDSYMAAFDRVRDSLINTVRTHPTIFPNVSHGLQRLVLSPNPKPPLFCNSARTPPTSFAKLQISNLKVLRHKTSAAWHALTDRFGTISQSQTSLLWRKLSR